jgi:hypothetical protein
VLIIVSFAEEPIFLNKNHDFGDVSRATSLFSVDRSDGLSHRKRSEWYVIAHEKFFRIPDAGRDSLDLNSIPSLYSTWFASYGKNKYARLQNNNDPDRFLFIRMYCRFMEEYKEMLKVKFGWLHFVKFTKILSFTVDPSRFFHLHEEFEAVNRGWHKMSSWLRKRYGKFFYIRVLEFQKTGRPHLHVLAVLPEWIDYAKMQELWDKKYDIGVQCRFETIESGKNIDGLKYVLKYVTKSMTVLSQSSDNLYSVLLFASNRRLFSLSDVRDMNAISPVPMLERKHHRVIATWCYVGSVFASQLQSFCREVGLLLDDFMEISRQDAPGGFGFLFGDGEW